MVSFAAALYERPGIEGQRRRQIVQILRAALQAVDPAEAVRRFMARRGVDLHRIQAIGFGETPAAMPAAAPQERGPALRRVVVKVLVPAE